MCWAPAWHSSGTRFYLRGERTEDNEWQSLGSPRQSRSTPHTQQCPQGNCYLGNWRECRPPHLAENLTLHVSRYGFHEVQHGGVDPALVHLGVRGVEYSRIFWSWSYLVTGGDLTPHQARHQTEEHQAWTGECPGVLKCREILPRVDIFNILLLEREQKQKLTRSSWW